MHRDDTWQSPHARPSLRRLVHVYSLKDTATPEFAFVMDSGVTSLAFHPRHHMLLAVGCYDGSVRIFDVRSSDGEPLFRADFNTGKHADPVWGVHLAHTTGKGGCCGGGGSGGGAASAETAATVGKSAILGAASKAGGDFPSDANGPAAVGDSTTVLSAAVGLSGSKMSAAAVEATPAAAATAAAAASTSATGGSAGGAGAVAVAGGGGMGELALYSVSADGTVAHWLVTKSELTMETVMQLPVICAPAPLTLASPTQVHGLSRSSVSDDAASPLRSSEPPESGVEAAAGVAGSATAATVAAAVAADEDAARAPAGLAAGTCLAFSPFHESVFLVGTEEGRVHKCSLDFAGEYLATFSGHTMPVYAVRWSPYHPRVFLSASADWTVRLWDDAAPGGAAVMVFDLGTALGDVAWSLHSATTFAAATDEGKVYVYDLAVNPREALSEQKVVRKARASHLLFMRAAGGALLIAGDSAGGVTALKLSPNLRRTAPQPPTAVVPLPPVRRGEVPRELPSRCEAELRKLDRLLEAAAAAVLADALSSGTGAAPVGAVAAACMEMPGRGDHSPKPRMPVTATSAH